MSKPKNPYRKTDDWDAGRAYGKAEGLVLGEKRLARALRKWMDKNFYRDTTGNFALGEFQEFDDWLTARLKRGKK